MYSIKLPAEPLRAAQLCQADLDVRYYLNGIFLGVNGDIVSTNGHVMFKGSMPDNIEIPQDTIIKLSNKLYAKANEVELFFDVEMGGQLKNIAIEHYGSFKYPKTRVQEFTVVDGEFPDYQKVINDQTKKGNKKQRAQYVQPQYLSLVSKVYPAKDVRSVHFSINDNKKAMIVKPQGMVNEYLEGSLLLIMPITEPRA